MSTLNNLPVPITVTVQTAGFTVPAGRSARITVNLEGTATFTINGVLALRGTQNSVLGSSPLKQNSSAPLSLAANSGAAGASDAFVSATDQKTTVATFSVPTGTVLNGTGTFRYVVEQYPG
jgi:hypothetical protein